MEDEGWRDRLRIKEERERGRGECTTFELFTYVYLLIKFYRKAPQRTTVHGSYGQLQRKEFGVSQLPMGRGLLSQEGISHKLMIMREWPVRRLVGLHT